MKTLSMYGGDVTLEFDGRKHAYKHVESGLFVPGVTSILQRLDKPALVQWAANMAVADMSDRLWVRLNSEGPLLDMQDVEDAASEAKTAHRRFSKSAADIGSEVHAFAEKALTGQRVSIPKNRQANKGAVAFLDWLHTRKTEPIDCERMVFSKRFFYAGTCDFYGLIDGELCVLDFKTSSGLYLEMLLQLAAYQIAIEEEQGEQIDAGWIVRLDKKTGKFEPYRIPYSNRHRDAFLRVREAHELLCKIEDEIDGIRQQAKAA